MFDVQFSVQKRLAYSAIVMEMVVCGKIFFSWNVFKSREIYLDQVRHNLNDILQNTGRLSVAYSNAVLSSIIDTSKMILFANNKEI